MNLSFESRNLQIKLWKLVQQAIDLQKETLPELRYDEELNDYRKKLREARNVNLRAVNHQYLFARNLAVVIARVHSMVSVAWTTPGQVKRDAAEFQHLLGTILLVLAPIAPHFMSELWAGLRTVPVKHCQEFDWNSDLFQQKWPELDPTFNLPIKVVCNKRKEAELQVAKWMFDSLSLEQAFDLACHNNNVQDNVLPNEILDKSLQIHEDFEAVLTINYKAPKEKKYEYSFEEFKAMKGKMKEEKKAAKIERLAKREKKIRMLEELKQRKAAQEIPKNNK